MLRLNISMHGHKKIIWGYIIDIIDLLDRLEKC